MTSVDRGMVRRTGSVLVGFDGSPAAEAAVRWACAEAQLRNLEVTVLRSWHEPMVDDRSWRERWEDPAAQERAAATRLQGDADRLASSSTGLAPKTLLVSERPADALVAAADDCELVVVGSRGHGGFAALALGSVAERVGERAPVPVAIVRSEDPAGDGIVVGVDGSTGSRRALLWAAEEGRVRSKPVTAVLAWSGRPPPGARVAQPFGAAATEDDARMALHRTVVEQVGGEGARHIRLAVACAPASKALLDAAVGAELLVLGADLVVGRDHGRLGSVARQVLRHAPCPVVVAR